MAAITNTVTTAEMVTSLDIEMTSNFDGSANRLMEVLGIFGVETMAAGTALFQYEVTGALNTAEVAEGDEVPLSKYKVSKKPIGVLDVKPYRKLTTAQAILKGGFVNSVAKTDAKMLKDVRAGILKDFFDYLGNGTGTAEGEGLQGALAFADATLRKTAEDNGDEIDRIVHFVNMMDSAAYLAKAEITMQNVYGMSYLQSFLGVTDVFLTSKVPAGTVYATPVENLRIFGVDFGTLGESGLTYTVSDAGLIGVAHTPKYERTAAETYVLAGMTIIPEVLDYIVEATISDVAPAKVTTAMLADGAVTTPKIADKAVTAAKLAEAAASDEPAPAAEEPAADDPQAESIDAPKTVNAKSTTAELEAYAAAHGVDLAGARNNAERLSIIEAETGA